MTRMQGGRGWKSAGSGGGWGEARGAAPCRGGRVRFSPVSSESSSLLMSWEGAAACGGASS